MQVKLAKHRLPKDIFLTIFLIRVKHLDRRTSAQNFNFAGTKILTLPGLKISTGGCFAGAGGTPGFEIFHPFLIRMHPIWKRFIKKH